MNLHTHYFRTFPVLIPLVLLLCFSHAGAQAVLDGVSIPRDRLIAFIMIGHSNLVGRTNKPKELREHFYSTHPRAWNFNIVDEFTPEGPHHAWIPAYPMIHRDIRAVRDDLGEIAGPSVVFLKALAKRFPHSYFGVIQNAESQASCPHYLNNTNNYKKEPWKGPPLYEQIIEAAKEARKTAALGGVITFFSVMETEPDSFAEDMISLMAKFRTDLEEPELPLLISEWEQGATGRWSPTTSTGKKVIEATNALPGMMSNCYVIPTGFSKDIDQYMNDDHHFNLAGNIKWADTAVKIIAENGLVYDRPPDIQPPSVPANLVASNAGVSRIQLNWTASSDNDLVRNYIVFSGGDSIGVAGPAGFLVTDARSCTNYAFSVRAVDFSNNRSAASATLTHSSICSGDVLPPTKPAGLDAEDIGTASLTLTWTASSDDVGVSGYNVYRNSALEGSVTGTRFPIRDLSPGTSYTFRVVAVDAAGNLSDPSETFSVSTLSFGIASLPLSVNMGGESVGIYQEDKAWKDQGDFGFTGTSTIETCPAAGLYATARAGDFTYKVSVPNGYYRVTMRFMECGVSAPGQRVFSAGISGVPPVAIDIFASAGGNKEYAVTKDVLVASGMLEITLTSAGAGIPVLSGLTVEEVPAFTIQYPDGGETVMIGQTISIRWSSNIYLAPEALLYISTDRGTNWYPIVDPVNFQSDDWEDYTWTIPQSIAGIPLASTACLLKITDYNLVYSDVSDAEFTITPFSGIESPGSKEPQAGKIALVRHGLVSRLLVEAPGPEYTVGVFSLDGKLLRSFRGQGQGVCYFGLGQLSEGLYQVTVRCEAGAFSRLIAHTGR